MAPAKKQSGALWFVEVDGSFQSQAEVFEALAKVGGFCGGQYKTMLPTGSGIREHKDNTNMVLVERDMTVIVKRGVVLDVITDERVSFSGRSTLDECDLCFSLQKFPNLKVHIRRHRRGRPREDVKRAIVKGALGDSHKKAGAKAGITGDAARKYR